jgi:zinc transporter ZupT
MLFLLLAATLTGLCTGLGTLPFFFVNRLPRRIYDLVLGFGAGLMLAAATLGLLAEAMHSVRPQPGGPVDLLRLLTVIVGFALGFVILIVVERFIPHEHAGGHREHIARELAEEAARRRGVCLGVPADAAIDTATHADPTAAPAPHLDGHGQPHHDSPLQPDNLPARPGRGQAIRHGILITGALVFHRLPEGFAIGAAFSSGALRSLGILVAASVALQNVCEGLVMAAPLRHAGLRPWRAMGITAATGLTVPVGAVVGYLLSQHLLGALPLALALAAGSLIAVVSNEIIPETHSHGNEIPATFGVVAGFAAIILMRALLGGEH